MIGGSIHLLELRD